MAAHLLHSPVNSAQAGSFARNSDVNQNEEKQLTLKTLLWILLIFALVAIIRTSSRNAKWGYGPSIGIGLVMLIVLILVLLGYI
ncbi:MULTISPECIES: DUF3309 family protein [Nitrosospira]|uniref:DUF3309 family protein n=1 Tax=Nitrosospira TaxID=35798 RepID=UPI00210B56D5|nr:MULTISPECIES: DUF3309 family protein [Nitrosospira]